MTAPKSAATKNTTKKSGSAANSKRKAARNASAGRNGSTAGGTAGDGNSTNHSNIEDVNDILDEEMKNDSFGPTDAPRDKNRYKYRVEIQQMMFVSGETNEPPEKITDLIEDIVRDQVVSLLLQAQKSVLGRGQKSVLPEDLIFLIRHDKAKVNRLRTYLSWKDVRKNAKDQENGDIGTAAGSGGGVGTGDLLEDIGANGVANNMESKLVTKQKKTLKLPWELEFMFSEQPLSLGKGDNEIIDEEERDAVLAQIKRLKQNDERTRDMTQEEYVHWSECRQASFTFRKSKKFREWCGISHVTESRPSDDVIDILGFLTFELVCSVTEEALHVKQCIDLNSEQSDGLNKKRKYLFMEPSNDNKPISVEHVQEAWRKLQMVSTKHKALFNFRGGRMKRNVRLI